MTEIQIPKIIMQTWKNDTIPDHWKASPASIKKYMPDWKYVLMTDEMNREFCAKHFPDFLSTYDNFPHPIQRADAIRYMFLYKFGGLYIDMDIELLHDLSPLFTQDADVFLVRSGNIGSILTNSFMASRPRCPIWLKMLSAIQTNWGYQPWMIGKHLTVMNTTGPMMLNRVVNNEKFSYVMLPSALMMPCSVCELEDGICDPKGAYVRPLIGQSWNSWDSRLLNFILCRHQKFLWILAVLFFISLFIFFVFLRR